MDKFCTKCGNQLNEGDVFCSNCGSKTDNDQAAVTNAPQPSESSVANPQQPSFSTGGMANSAFAAPGKKRKKALIIGISAAAVAVLAAGAVLLCYLFGIFGSRGYKAAINNVLKIEENIFNEGFYSVDREDFRALLPESVWERLEYEDDMDFDEAFDELIEEMESDEDDYESIADLYGGDIRISFSVSDVEHLSSSELSDFVDKLHDHLKISKRYITDVCTVKGDLTFKGDDDEKTDKFTFYCAEIDGEWYVFDQTGGMVNVLSCIEVLDLDT